MVVVATGVRSKYSAHPVTGSHGFISTERRLIASSLELCIIEIRLTTYLSRLSSVRLVRGDKPVEHVRNFSRIIVIPALTSSVIPQYCINAFVIYMRLSAAL
jgi:hypothetical protein